MIIDGQTHVVDGNIGSQELVAIRANVLIEAGVIVAAAQITIAHWACRRAISMR